MISREAQKKLLDLASKFKCVAVTGARQCGKTTLVKQTFQELQTSLRLKLNFLL